MFTSKRLSETYKKSKEINIDDSSRVVLISDCHRGDNSRADDFANNRPLFLSALNYYYKNNYIYIEIGDGDELWENRKLEEIKRCHKDVFELMSKFYKKDRFYMILGNHDMIKKSEKYVEKNLYYYKDKEGKKRELFNKIKVYEGIIINYLNKKNKIFIIHGHQGDLINDRLWFLGRFLIRYLWRPLSIYLGFKDPTSPAKNYKKKRKVERKIIRWVKENNQMLIAGHTHRPMFPKTSETPYFNDGSCVHPRAITCIEVEKGDITLVKWSITAKKDGTLYVDREIITGPKKLEKYFN